MAEQFPTNVAVWADDLATQAHRLLRDVQREQYADVWQALGLVLYRALLIRNAVREAVPAVQLKANNPLDTEEDILGK